MEPKLIDACGLSCPQPALLTRQAISDPEACPLQVLVDSASARDNVVRTAENAGLKATVQVRPHGIFQILLVR